MKDISLKDLVAHACHFGQKSTLWNPKMKKYIYCKRNGIHILDLHKTAEGLIQALDFIKNAHSQGKTILFVGTKQQAKKILGEVKQKTASPIVTQKWICGLLTNYDTVKHRIKYLNELEEEEKSGEIEKYTKKEQTKRRKEKEKLELCLGGVKDMDRLPDVVFVLDCVRDKNAVAEARKLKIPVVGIVDTNADPDLIDHVIPANDDAIKSITYILELVLEVLVSTKKGESQKQTRPNTAEAAADKDTIIDPTSVDKPASVDKGTEESPPKKAETASDKA